MVARVQHALEAAVVERTLPTRRRRLNWTVGAPAFIPAVPRSTWSLHVKVAQHRDDGARSALVSEYAANVRSLARTYYRHREPLEDLVQVAMEALVLAIDRFEPERRIPFLGYANPTITGTIKRYYRDAAWSIRLPRRVHDLAGSARQASELLCQDLGRLATQSEIADVIRSDERSVGEAIEATSRRAVVSIDEPIEGDPDVQQLVAEMEPGYRWVEERAALRRAMATLTAEQRHILARYFGDSLTQGEIAREIGRSQVHVSRVLAISLRRLRDQL